MRGGGEAAEIFTQSGCLQILHATDAAVLQQQEFIVGMKNARHPINKIPNTQKLRIRWPFQRGAMLQRGRSTHANAFRVVSCRWLAGAPADRISLGTLPRWHLKSHRLVAGPTLGNNAVEGRQGRRW